MVSNPNLRPYIADADFGPIAFTLLTDADALAHVMQQNADNYTKTELDRKGVVGRCKLDPGLKAPGLKIST